MKIKNVIEGLQILAKYEEKGAEAYINGADHDVIYGRSADIADSAEMDEYGDPIPIDKRMTPEDHQRMTDAGWFIDLGNEVWMAYA